MLCKDQRSSKSLLDTSNLIFSSIKWFSFNSTLVCFKTRSLNLSCMINFLLYWKCHLLICFFTQFNWLLGYAFSFYCFMKDGFAWCRTECVLLLECCLLTWVLRKPAFVFPIFTCIICHLHYALCFY